MNTNTSTYNTEYPRVIEETVTERFDSEGVLLERVKKTVTRVGAPSVITYPISEPFPYPCTFNTNNTTSDWS